MCRQFSIKKYFPPKSTLRFRFRFAVLFFSRFWKKRSCSLASVLYCALSPHYAWLAISRKFYINVYLGHKLTLFFFLIKFWVTIWGHALKNNCKRDSSAYRFTGLTDRSSPTLQTKSEVLGLIWRNQLLLFIITLWDQVCFHCPQVAQLMYILHFIF